MKAKDFFVQLQNQGKISHEEYVKFIESVPEFDIPDNAVKAFEEKFMTAERASSHPDVAWKLKAQALNPLDNDIKSMLAVYDTVDKYAALDIARLTRSTKDGEVPDTYKQFQALTAALPKILDKVRVAPNDEETKKKISDQTKVIDDLKTKFAEVEKQKEEWKKGIETEYNKREKDYKINGYLEKLAGEYKFAEAYEPNRSVLTKAILGEIKSSNLFDITKKNEDDVLDVFELKDGVMSPKFNGNNPVTPQSLLDEKFKSFLKQNGSNDNQQMRTHQFRVDDKQPAKARQGASVSATV